MRTLVKIFMAMMCITLVAAPIYAANEGANSLSTQDLNSSLTPTDF